MPERWFLFIIIILLGVLIFVPFSSLLKLKQFLFLGQGTGTEHYGDLAVENTALKARLAQLWVSQREPPVQQATAIPAFVYSRYQFNFKNEMLISIGKNQGIAVGEAAIISYASATSSLGDREREVVFIGDVDKVFDNTAAVQTIFDSRFRLSVRIGEEGIESLLIGGSEPKLTLVPKNAEIRKGDIIYSAGADIPYGLPIGEVGEVRMSSDNIFKEATIIFPYDLSDYQMVFILKNAVQDRPSDGR